MIMMYHVNEHNIYLSKMWFLRVLKLFQSERNENKTDSKTILDLLVISFTVL